MKRCYTVAVRDKFVTDGTTVNADDVQVLIFKIWTKILESSKGEEYRLTVVV